MGADYDDPSIMNNMIHQHVDETTDPTHMVESMVYRMGHEVQSTFLHCFGILTCIVLHTDLVLILWHTGACSYA